MVFKVKKSQIKGNGCFATKFIKKGELITKFKGKKYSIQEIDERIALSLLRIDDPLQIDEDRFIEIKGKELFFNHCCSPNSGIKRENQLYAIKDINIGEEITFDYSTVVGTNITDWSMKCKCNSKNCRKVIKNIKTLPKEKIVEYTNLEIIPKFILKQLEN